jgi:squalene/oxidosqualene cyclase-like protein
MKMQGYNGSQCWDTSFAIQAIVEGNFTEEIPECCRKVYDYLDRTQIKNDEENREYYFRHISKGGWPFSTAAHGWPISDCTSEGLKGVLALHEASLGTIVPAEKRICDDRLKDACNVILSYHNVDGGWATYENNRGYGWYELLNPSEVFGDIMIDYSYVECTSACITALKSFSKAFPDHRPTEVLGAIQAGRRFIKSIQRPDGSWYGSWGVCFTYATWFGLEGLISAGEPTDSPNVRSGVQFLLSKQNANGGWGESYLSCVNKVYSPDGTGEVRESHSLVSYL